MPPESMQSTYWTHPQGLRFRLGLWHSPSSTPRYGILFHHGIGEHIGRYESIVQGLSPLPLACAGYDCRGHGASDGKRGDANGLDELARDLETLIPVLIERTGVQRFFLYGHSMGGAVVLHYLVNRPVHNALVGFILSSPALSVPLSLQQKALVGAGLVLSHLIPHQQFSTGIDTQAISRDPDQITRYLNDPLVHSKVSSKLGVSLTLEPKRDVECARRVTLPALIFHGTADRVCSIEGSRDLVKRLGSTDITFHEMPGYFHECHHEPRPDAERVFQLIREWLAPRIDYSQT